jgi:VanZ family protein
LQLAVDGRHFLLSDLLIDMTGIIIGLLMAVLVRFLQQRKLQHTSPHA